MTDRESWTFTDRDPYELLEDYRRERTALIRQLRAARDQIKSLRRQLQVCREPEPIEVHEPRTRQIDADRELLTAEESARVSPRYRIVAQMQGHWLTFAKPRAELWADMPWTPMKEAK